MCGFACIFRKSSEPKDIPENLLSHRGPDFNNQIRLPNMCLRHWRLSIVDLSTESNQPINKDQYILAYNGELYDYADLGKNIFNKNYRSDTRLFFDLLKNSYESLIDSQSGFYSYLFFDKKSFLLKGGRDFFGKKNLYYYIDDDIACFSSEEKAIKRILLNENKRVCLSKKSFDQYIDYKDVFFGKTFYEGIREIPPGARLNFDFKSWRLNINYDWDHYYKTPLRDKASLIVDNANERLEKSRLTIEEEITKDIKSRLNCDVDVQIALSGGLDSTLISTILKKENFQKKIIKSINVGFSETADESLKAKKTADFLRIEHKSISFNDLDFLGLLKESIISYGSPLSHPHSLAYNILTKEAKKKGKVLITGEGADELFWGYNHYLDDFDEGFAFRKFLDTDKFLKKQNLYNNSENLIIKTLKTNANKNIYNSQDMEMKTHLLSLLRRNDKISMSNSIEIRSPFLDINLLDLINHYKTKDKNLYNKKILLKILRKYNQSFKRDKTKIGFYVPFDEWFLNHKEDTVVKKILKNALTFYEDFLRFSFFDKENINTRLGWILMNTGIFLENE